MLNMQWHYLYSKDNERQLGANNEMFVLFMFCIEFHSSTKIFFICIKISVKVYFRSCDRVLQFTEPPS
jgi:hypothetical protein